ncbi:UNVERIFIED_CONTAM: hypothetical protein HHA_452180 [Hammondia hammondi]|eukprot:XP_008885220.1 hypothetical protein HHA_452180 [Hammondia hammondi]
MATGSKVRERRTPVAHALLRYARFHAGDRYRGGHGLEYRVREYEGGECKCIAAKNKNGAATEQNPPK